MKNWFKPADWLTAPLSEHDYRKAWLRNTTLNVASIIPGLVLFAAFRSTGRADLQLLALITIVIPLFYRAGKTAREDLARRRLSYLYPQAKLPGRLFTGMLSLNPLANLLQFAYFARVTDPSTAPKLPICFRRSHYVGIFSILTGVGIPCLGALSASYDHDSATLNEFVYWNAQPEAFYLHRVIREVSQCLRERIRASLSQPTLPYQIPSLVKDSISSTTGVILLEVIVVNQARQLQKANPTDAYLPVRSLMQNSLEVIDTWGHLPSVLSRFNPLIWINPASAISAVLVGLIDIGLEMQIKRKMRDTVLAKIAATKIESPELASEFEGYRIQVEGLKIFREAAKSNFIVDRWESLNRKLANEQ